MASPYTRFGGVVLGVVLLAGCGRVATNSPRVIVLGIDGMDPGFVERHWAELPNLAKLREEGGFRRLATTNPPQSPVAWSTVITGMDPAGHGIFDFLHREAESITPYSSIAEAQEGRRKITVGSYVLPLENGQVRSLRKGKAFWQYLGDQKIPATVMRMPVNFPPSEFAGESLAGMGTPDLEGGTGTFSYFSADAKAVDREVAGGRIRRIEVRHQKAVLRVQGPVNAFRKDRPVSGVDVVVEPDGAAKAARVTVGSVQLLLQEGEWSPWLRIAFPLLGRAAEARGIVRILLLRTEPLQVYVSPVNLDPLEPALPISTPASYSRTLAEAVGLFHTQGIAEDTAAIRAEVLNHAQFLEQAGHVLEDSMKLYRHELEAYRDGLLFFYFSSVDQQSHILWGDRDDELLGVYRRMDEAVGMARAKVGAEGTLLVMSDHGFSTFRRAVHLNTWLLREGYLKLLDGSRATEGTFGNVDWVQTRAYALGLNEIYINVAGREPNGIVARGEARRAVMQEIREKLKAWRDPQTGEGLIDEVHVVEEDPKLPAHAPDLLIGYRPGYRASWQTALGGIPAEVLEDNREAWLADHCIEPRFVPGVLFSNRKLRAGEPHLRDVPVTILGLFGLSKPEQMTGVSVF